MRINGIVMIYDIHSHHALPYPEGIVNWDIITMGNTPGVGERCSLGIHPWNAGADDVDAAFARMMEYADAPEVKMIGECGIDTVRGAAPLFQQMLLFKRHIELSESVAKPLIIHEVKAHDIIVGLRKEYRCSQPWIIHGFRGKPTVAKMLLDAGCHLSFGERYNADTVAMVPLDRLFVETDESPLPIADIIASISRTRGEDISPSLLRNMQMIIND